MKVLYVNGRPIREPEFTKAALDEAAFIIGLIERKTIVGHVFGVLRFDRSDGGALVATQVGCWFEVMCEKDPPVPISEDEIRSIRDIAKRFAARNGKR